MQILAKCRPEEDDERLFRVFLSSFIAPMFARCSSRIEDLQVQQAIPSTEFADMALITACPATVSLTASVACSTSHDTPQ